jgi:hypothetical protein
MKGQTEGGVFFTRKSDIKWLLIAGAIAVVVIIVTVVMPAMR